MDSPSAYNRPSPHLRRTSDYLNQVERERSVSVSPKTKVPPRPTSLSSRHSSSQQDAYSNRSSLQTSVAQLAGSPSHVIQPPQNGVAPQANTQNPNSANEVAQHASSSSQYGMPNPYLAGASYGAESSLSQRNNQPVTPAIQHQTQRMGMDHLVTPSRDMPLSAMNGNGVDGDAVTSTQARSKSPPKPKSQSPNIFMKPSPTPKKQLKQTPPVRREQHVEIEDDDANTQSHLVTEEQQGPAPKESKLGDFTAASTAESKQQSLKRPAEAPPVAEPPAKHRKTQRKYLARPIWARLSKHNPRFYHQMQDGVPVGDSSQVPPRPNAAQVNGQANGQASAQALAYDAGVAGRDPWQLDPPLDHDLIHVQQVRGTKWEKSFLWNTPYPDQLRVVQDWIYVQLDQLGDAGTNPEEGTVEIEAKIGTLLKEGSRCDLPVSDISVVDPNSRYNRQLNFESQMTPVSVSISTSRDLGLTAIQFRNNTKP